MLKRLFGLFCALLLSAFAFSDPVYANDSVQSYMLGQLVSSASETVTDEEFVPVPDTLNTIDLRGFISDRARTGSEFRVDVYGLGDIGSGKWIEINPDSLSARVSVQFPPFEPISLPVTIGFKQGDRLRLEVGNFHGDGGYRIDIERGGRAWLNFENFRWDRGAAPPVRVFPHAITRWNDRETRADFYFGPQFQSYFKEGS